VPAVASHMDSAYAHVSEKSHTGFHANRKEEKRKRKSSVQQRLLIYK
jgi:hypothetical protein